MILKIGLFSHEAPLAARMERARIAYEWRLREFRRILFKKWQPTSWTIAAGFLPEEANAPDTRRVWSAEEKWAEYKIRALFNLKHFYSLEGARRECERLTAEFLNSGEDLIAYPVPDSGPETVRRHHPKKRK